MRKVHDIDISLAFQRVRRSGHKIPESELIDLAARFRDDKLTEEIFLTGRLDIRNRARILKYTCSADLHDLILGTIDRKIQEMGLDDAKEILDLMPAKSVLRLSGCRNRI